MSAGLPLLGGLCWAVPAGRPLLNERCELKCNDAEETSDVVKCDGVPGTAEATDSIMKKDGEAALG